MLSAEEIASDLNTLRDIVIRHKAPDAPLAVGSALINDIETPVFTKVPQNLHGLYRLALNNPDLPFLICGDERYSYGETYRLANNLATALINEYGIAKGDRIAVCSRNNPQWCITYMAITMIGAIVVPMNSWWQGSEMLYGLQDSGTRLLFADQERIDRLQPCLNGISLQIVAIGPEANSPWQDFRTLILKGADLPPLRMEDREIFPEDAASIMYTSGSTGHPKGVLSSHRAIISALYSWLFVKEITEILRPELREDNPQYQPGILANVPLFHVTGSHAQFLASFIYHRKFVMMYKWNAEQALELIEKERLSVLHGVPTMTWEVMNSPQFAHTDLSSLRNVQSGGASRPPEHLAMMQKKFPERAIPGLGYGLTETNALGAIITGKFYLSKPDSTGRPIAPLTSIRIVNEDGEVLDNGQIGEICIKGPTIMMGYWNKPEETARVLKDGWFHTGDLGLLDEHGFLIIKDRAKDIVIRGGENIGCAEVEYALAKHPEVCEVAVFGLPDERLGEIVAATVMVKPNSTITEAELQAFLQTHLARFKIPSRIWLQSEQLERIASGKIAKKQIRDALIKAMSIY
ncbi:MAG: class I adenylate-forming enzyme family protein [Gammaproteobacteria bacterium]|nr:class I adenylate-forming enzyme family protein [Gammaproteobacteria bacterium]